MRLLYCVYKCCKRKKSVIGHEANRCRSNEWESEQMKVVAY